MPQSVEALLFGGNLHQVLAIGLLVAARIAPLTVAAPWLLLRRSPGSLRAALILVLTLSFAPLCSNAVVPDGAGPFIVAMLREATLGLVFAVASALPFFSVDWSGRLIDTWRGSSMAELTASPTGERSSPLGVLQLMGAIALFAAFGGHRLALGAFAEGLRIAPVGAGLGAPVSAALALEAAQFTGVALAFAVALAAPALVAIVLTEAALGLVARAAPQIPIFFAGMPLRAAVGIAATLLALAAITPQLPEAFHSALSLAERWVRPSG